MSEKSPTTPPQGGLQSKSSLQAEKSSTGEPSVKERAADKAGEIKDDVKQAADNKRREITEKSKSFVEEKRTTAVSRIGHLRDAVEKASDHLRDNNEQTMADYAQMLADQCDSLSRYADTSKPDKVINDISRQVSRQPVLFFGGLFVAGLAISRFLKASEPETMYPPEDYGRGVPETSHLQDSPVLAKQPVPDSPIESSSPTNELS